MWSTRSKQLANNRISWFAIDYRASPVSCAQVLQLWSDDPVFRGFFISVLSSASYPVYRWETPPITQVNANRPFEFVLLDSPGLAGSPDVHIFAEHFRGEKPGAIIEFPNLGGDAIMVVPCPNDQGDDYSHLAAFIRNAPESALHQLWATVGVAMQRQLSNKPVWLSTAGGGVAWLHVRLDNRPKYYSYEPYRLYAEQ